MKYEFRVGDYVQMTDGRVGYIQRVEDLKDGCDIFVVYVGVNAKIHHCVDDYVVYDGYSYTYDTLFNRIGKYDFTENDKRIERMQIQTVPFDFEYRDSKIMWDKINEIIDYINKNEDTKK